MDLCDRLALSVIDGHSLNRAEARDIISSSDDELLTVLQAAFRIRLAFHGRVVKVHILKNAKSGICPEDCSFCSQSLVHRSRAEVAQYDMISEQELRADADAAVAAGACTYCIVTSARSPTAREIDIVCRAAKSIKGAHRGFKLCASLGLLQPEQAARLVGAGIDRYNHNLETSPSFFPQVVTSHRFEDRAQTLKVARQAGLELCSGGILGLGEAPEDRVELALALRELAPESVPVNFLDPRPGTPLDQRPKISPAEALRALAMFRFVHPRADLRVAGGREATLGAMQPLALYAANSLFTRGYLTTPGTEPSDDWKMMTEAGFEPKLIEA